MTGTNSPAKVLRADIRTFSAVGDDSVHRRREVPPKLNVERLRATCVMYDVARNAAAGAAAF